MDGKMRVLPGNGLVVSKSGNRNTGGMGEAGPRYRNVSAGVTSSRSGVSAIYDDGRGAYRTVADCIGGDGGATPGSPLKWERRVKTLVTLQLTVAVVGVTQTIRGTETLVYGRRSWN
tara:strand:- start:2285 stop:2635 length:351 start_codon:yes stop_codon:yes gene_type:complete